MIFDFKKLGILREYRPETKLDMFNKKQMQTSLRCNRKEGKS